jgi:murein L,D-transpeptidase YcbB/YkuD
VAGVQAALAGTEGPFGASQVALKSALAQYRAIASAGGWPAVPDGPALRQGSSGSAVARLRQRLAVTGDLVDRTGDSQAFDDDLAAAVMRFQARHGLAADGVVGWRTRGALNVPAESRVRQIAASIARLRALPDGDGGRFILVNVAGFDLAVFDDGRPLFRSPVIVGRTSRPTPIFSSAITRIITNPYWRVPRGIAVQDILPKLKRDPSYLGAQSIRVYGNNHGGLTEVPGGSVNWRSLNKDNFPYVLVQDPGPLNALGRIKFFIPNELDVYLHDTPARELFTHATRAFSSGCIRIQRARDLAELLLRQDDGGRLQAMENALEKGETTEIPLAKAVPVHVAYLTAWTDEEGHVQFRDDVYALDGLTGAGPADVAGLRHDAGATACSAPANLGDIRY